MMRIRTLVVLGVLVLMGLSAGAAQALPGLTTGFFSDPVLTTESAATRAIWLPRAVNEGAGMVRININWAAVAPQTRPAGFNASNPASPGYNWTAIDSQVRALHSYGLKILITITNAPTWAEGADIPKGETPGTWKPSAVDYGAFASAAAKRYGGHFPDPSQPGTDLPKVSDWQGWNEPNLSVYLSPAWVRSGHRWVAESPIIFRGLMNALYKSVKAVSKSNLVILGGTAPYGDPPGGERIPPAEFDRALFCLNGRTQLTPTPCSNPVHADAIDHHPYGVAGPLSPALNPDDVAVPDIYKLTRILHAAERSGHILPAGPKQVWVTEISWDSNPPDPQGVPIQRQARWYEQSMYVLWRQGVDTVMFLQLVDSPPIPNYASSYQSGLYYLNGNPKPSAIAFRFPFVTSRLKHTQIQAWGRAPQSGKLTIEQYKHGDWKPLKRLAVQRRQVFVSNLAITGGAVLRAQIGSQTSLSWTES